MFALGVLVAGLLSFAAVESQETIIQGTCPTPDLQENFDPATFFDGTYLELAKVPNIFQQFFKCERAEYSIDETTGIVTVFNRGVFTTPENYGDVNTGVGEADCDANEPARCRVKFPPGPYDDYLVLKSGKKFGSRYAIIYSCLQRGSEYRLLAFIISEKKLPPFFFNYLRDELANSLELTTPAKRALIETTRQSGCQRFYSRAGL